MAKQTNIKKKLMLDFFFIACLALTMSSLLVKAQRDNDNDDFDDAGFDDSGYNSPQNHDAEGSHHNPSNYSPSSEEDLDEDDDVDESSQVAKVAPHGPSSHPQQQFYSPANSIVMPIQMPARRYK